MEVPGWSLPAETCVDHDRGMVAGSERTSVVCSADGTPIGYRQLGAGPGLVILHGGMEHSGDYTDLMRLLGASLTTYAMDRRGRGMSGTHGTRRTASSTDTIAKLRPDRRRRRW